MNTDLTPDEMRSALVELCAAGLLTCTRGNPGDADRFPESVRRRHAENMRALLSNEETT